MVEAELAPDEMRGGELSGAGHRQRLETEELD